ncbi:hypothetical protein [Enemella sp. A6]|uniref:hypothetical protein n=1 Tax=Enemella sp. A6 TaxID=3440152 RepID=UPI003EBDEBC3
MGPGGPGHFGGGDHGFPPQGGFGGPPQPPKKSNSWVLPLVIGLVVLLMAGGGFALYWFVLRDTPTEESSGSSPQTTQGPQETEPQETEPGDPDPRDPAGQDPEPGDTPQQPAGEGKLDWPESFGDWKLAPGSEEMDSVAVYVSTSGAGQLVTMYGEEMTVEQLYASEETVQVDGITCISEAVVGSYQCAADHNGGVVVGSSSTEKRDELAASMKELLAAL